MWVISIGLVLSVTLISLSSPPTSAGHPVTFMPPYAGGLRYFSPYGHTANQSGTCAATTESAYSHSAADLTTGFVHLNATGKVNSICNTGPPGTGQAYVGVGFRSPVFSISSAGRHNVQFNWVVDWTARVSWSTNSWAGVQGTIFGSIWDITSNGPVNHSKKFLTFASFGGSMTAGNASKTVKNSTQTLNTSGVLIVGHTYRVITYIWLAAQAGLSWFNAGSAFATINLGFVGNHGFLSSMTIS
jgi:hypothetical protein